ncbi:MAG: aminotransferase class I/II [Azospira oryzae]|jgi:histidinol-phosphate aminotransferase|nr:MAG: aminotransferase class I/II [Azospira oryzae]
MRSTMSRRNWLKTSALLTGGASLLPGAFTTASANPLMLSSDTNTFHFREEEFALDVPKLKARLFANENPFGPSEKAKKAIQEALSTSYQYPFMMLRELGQKIADYEGVKAEQIMLSSGSSPILHGAALLFSRNGGNVISADPTYDDLLEKAEALGAQVIKVPLTKEYKLDLDEMEKRVNDKTSLVYICNPNNPTATVVDTARLKAFCERVSQKTTIFIDEAYIDYLDNPRESSMMETMKKGKNIIIARTFSKLYGFAGLRVGYAVTSEDLVKKLSPYTVSWAGISATSGSAALVSYNDKEFLADALKKTIASKEYLYSVLKKEGYEYIPSSANFVMFPVNMDAERFTDEMMKRGVGVRPWQFAGKQWCRVSIGRMDEMQAFAEAFKQIS